MLKASYFTRIFDFKFPAGTSRGVLHQKTSSFIVLEEVSEVSTNSALKDVPVDITSSLLSSKVHQPSSDHLFFAGIGECSTIPELSPDPMDRHESKLEELCEAINQSKNPEDVDLKEFPSIRFGLEMAMLEAKQKKSASSSVFNLNAADQFSRTAYSSLNEFLSAPHLLFPSVRVS